jgi:hypothetical protein
MEEVKLKLFSTGPLGDEPPKVQPKLWGSMVVDFRGRNGFRLKN